jgi:predicted esterase YcpF (UPF0227 family)
VVTKDELLDMIDHSIHYSGENYAVVFYRRYIESVAESTLTDIEKADCRSVLGVLRDDAATHLEILRRLRKTVENDDRHAF